MHFSQISASSEADFISRISDELVLETREKMDGIEFYEKRPKLQGNIPY
jgi:hypothetical protein